MSVVDDAAAMSVADDAAVEGAAVDGAAVEDVAVFIRLLRADPRHLSLKGAPSAIARHGAVARNTPGLVRYFADYPGRGSGRHRGTEI